MSGSPNLSTGPTRPLFSRARPVRLSETARKDTDPKTRYTNWSYPYQTSPKPSNFQSPPKQLPDLEEDDGQSSYHKTNSSVASSAVASDAVGPPPSFAPPPPPIPQQSSKGRAMVPSLNIFPMPLPSPSDIKSSYAESEMPQSPFNLVSPMIRGDISFTMQQLGDEYIEEESTYLETLRLVACAIAETDVAALNDMRDCINRICRAGDTMLSAISRESDNFSLLASFIVFPEISREIYLEYISLFRLGWDIYPFTEEVNKKIQSILCNVPKEHTLDWLLKRPLARLRSYTCIYKKLLQLGLQNDASYAGEAERLQLAHDKIYSLLRLARARFSEEKRRVSALRRNGHYVKSGIWCDAQLQNVDALHSQLDLSKVRDVITLEPIRCELDLQPESLPYQRKIIDRKPFMFTMSHTRTGTLTQCSRVECILLTDYLLIAACPQSGLPRLMFPPLSTASWSLVREEKRGFEILVENQEKLRLVLIESAGFDDAREFIDLMHGAQAQANERQLSSRIEQMSLSKSMQSFGTNSLSSVKSLKGPSPSKARATFPMATTVPSPIAEEFGEEDQPKKSSVNGKPTEDESWEEENSGSTGFSSSHQGSSSFAMSSGDFTASSNISEAVQKDILGDLAQNTATGSDSPTPTISDSHIGSSGHSAIETPERSQGCEPSGSVGDDMKQLGKTIPESTSDKSWRPLNLSSSKNLAVQRQATQMVKPPSTPPRTLAREVSDDIMLGQQPSPCSPQRRRSIGTPSEARKTSAEDARTFAPQLPALPNLSSSPLVESPRKWARASVLFPLADSRIARDQENRQQVGRVLNFSQEHVRHGPREMRPHSSPKRSRAVNSGHPGSGSPSKRRSMQRRTLALTGALERPVQPTFERRGPHSKQSPRKANSALQPVVASPNKKESKSVGKAQKKRSRVLTKLGFLKKSSN